MDPLGSLLSASTPSFLLVVMLSNRKCIWRKWRRHHHPCSLQSTLLPCTDSNGDSSEWEKKERQSVLVLRYKIMFRIGFKVECWGELITSCLLSKMWVGLAAQSMLPSFSFGSTMQSKQCLFRRKKAVPFHCNRTFCPPWIATICLEDSPDNNLSNDSCTDCKWVTNWQWSPANNLSCSPLW